MHKNEKHFKNISKSFEKMQRTSERCFSEDNAKTKKTFIEKIYFFSGSIILSVDLLWILSTTFLGFGFKQVFSALIIIAEIYIGLLMIFFMKRKIFGFTVLSLGLLILILTLILKKSDFSLLSENVFLLICTFIAGTGFLLSAILKSKNKI